MGHTDGFAGGCGEVSGALATTRTYLEKRGRPARRLPPPPIKGLLLQRLSEPPLHFYRYLYGTVGKAHLWVDRLRLSEEELLDIIHDPQVEIWMLSVGGCPAGYCELDFNDYPDDPGYESGTAWVSYFGIMPEFQRLGLGAYLMSEALDRAFDRGIEKLCLHTNSLDHPRALRFYQKMGFAPYFRMTSQTVPLSEEEILALYEEGYSSRRPDDSTPFE